jgi:hypothetical protein
MAWVRVCKALSHDKDESAAKITKRIEERVTNLNSFYWMMSWTEFVVNSKLIKWKPWSMLLFLPLENVYFMLCSKWFGWVLEMTGFLPGTIEWWGVLPAFPLCSCPETRMTFLNTATLSNLQVSLLME